MVAAGEDGLDAVIKLLANQVDTTMAQLGRLDLDDIDSSVIVKNNE